MKIRIRRKGNLTRPWVVKQGRVVLSGHPTWEQARDFTHRYLNETTNHANSTQETNS